MQTAAKLLLEPIFEADFDPAHDDIWRDRRVFSRSKIDLHVITADLAGIVDSNLSAI